MSRESSPPPPAASAWLARLIVACSVALLLPLLWPLLTDRVFVYNDLTWFHLPMRYLYQQALQKSDSVLWTPAIFAGFYLHGEGQTGVFHPLHQLLYRLLPLGPAFNLEIAANYVAAFGGMWWLLQRLRFAMEAALAGAMLFAFSGFALLHHHHVNMVAVVAHLPWLLGAADALIVEDGRGARRLAFAAVALILGSAFLVGFPQAIWWDLLALSAFAVLRAAETGRWRALLPGVAAIGIGILLGGIQILPSADAAAQSQRAGLGPDFALSFALHPLNLLQLVSPYALAGGAYSADDFMWLHEFGVYSGALLPIALIWCWLRHSVLPERRALIAWATAVAAVSSVLMLGRYGGLATLLTHLPVIGSLRAPARYVVLLQFASTILAAIAVEDLLEIRAGRRPRLAGGAPLWIPAALGVATTAAFNGHLLPFGRGAEAPIATAAEGVVIVIVVTVLAQFAGRGRSWALPLLLIVTAADLGVYGLRFVYQEPPRSIGALVDRIPPAPIVPEDTYAAAPAAGPYRSNLLVLRGYRLTNGYAGLFPRTAEPLDSDLTLRLAGTRWRFAADGRRRPESGGMPRVRFLDQAGAPADGLAQLTADRAGRLGVDVETTGRRIVAFTERFHSGWRAESDGRPIQVVHVERDFLGCVVEAGAHHVELRFQPASTRHGAFVSLAGLALLAGVCAVWPRRRTGERVSG